MTCSECGREGHFSKRHRTWPRQVRARELMAQGFSYASIGRIMKVSRARAYQLVNPEKRYRS